MNRPALILTEAPPRPARAHLTALDTPEQIRAHMAVLRRAQARQNRRMILVIGWFLVKCTGAAFLGLALLRAGILVAQG